MLMTFHKGKKYKNPKIQQVLMRDSCYMTAGPEKLRGQVEQNQDIVFFLSFLLIY